MEELVTSIRQSRYQSAQRYLDMLKSCISCHLGRVHVLNQRLDQVHVRGGRLVDVGSGVVCFCDARYFECPIGSCSCTLPPAWLLCGMALVSPHFSVQVSVVRVYIV